MLYWKCNCKAISNWRMLTTLEERKLESPIFGIRLWEHKLTEGYRPCRWSWEAVHTPTLPCVWRNTAHFCCSGIEQTYFWLNQEAVSVESEFASVYFVLFLNYTHQKAFLFLFFQKFRSVSPGDLIAGVVERQHLSFSAPMTSQGRCC